jgi:hypothetical protein
MKMSMTEYISGEEHPDLPSYEEARFWLILFVWMVFVIATTKVVGLW